RCPSGQVRCRPPPLNKVRENTPAKGSALPGVRHTPRRICRASPFEVERMSEAAASMPRSETSARLPDVIVLAPGRPRPWLLVVLPRYTGHHHDQRPVQTIRGIRMCPTRSGPTRPRPKECSACSPTLRRPRLESLLSSGSLNRRRPTRAVPAPTKEETMNALIKVLARSVLLKGDLDYHLVRASMVLIFLLF